MRGLIIIKAFLFVGPSLHWKLGQPKFVKFDKDLVVIGTRENWVRLKTKPDPIPPHLPYRCTYATQCTP